MFVSMTAILLSGVCILIVICFFQVNRATRQIALIRAEMESEVRSIQNDVARLDEKLIAHLLERRSVRECTDEYRRRRAALLPGADPKFDDVAIVKHCQRKADRRAGEIRQRSLYTTAIAVVLTIFIVAGGTLATYAAFSSNESTSHLPFPSAAASHLTGSQVAAPGN